MPLCFDENITFCNCATLAHVHSFHVSRYPIPVNRVKKIVNLADVAQGRLVFGLSYS